MTTRDFFPQMQFIVFAARVEESGMIQFIGAPDQEIWDYLQKFDLDWDSWTIHGIEAIPADIAVYEVRVEVQTVDEGSDDISLAVMEVAPVMLRSRLMVPDAARPGQASKAQFTGAGTGTGLGEIRF